MKIDTKAKGEMDIPEDNLISVPEGIFGFEDYTKYALIDSDYEPFIWLQSTENKDVAFLIVDPFLICSTYETDIDDETLSKIGIKKPEDIIIMTIVTVPSKGKKITANFAGPLVINKNSRECMQVILNDNRWSTKVDIMEMLQNNGGEN
ncbi:MAG: flagellar assembly protein FliW [Treponema sp.]|nr:flagellar assembly protein FliW [Treponema sp.]